MKIVELKLHLHLLKNPLAEPKRLYDGQIPLPDRPGPGIDVNRDVIARYDRP